MVALIGISELLIVALIIALFYGVARVPEAARNLGRAKGALDTVSEELQRARREVIDKAAGIDEAKSSFRRVNRVLKHPTRALADVLLVSPLERAEPASQIVPPIETAGGEATQAGRSGSKSMIEVTAEPRGDGE